MKTSYITILRDTRTDMHLFRQTADRLARLLAAEALQRVKEKKTQVLTPLGVASGALPAHPIVLVPVLRSGLALLPAFLSFFPAATIGIVGIRRDETTAAPHPYYQNLPRISSEALVIVLDPMIATGGTAVDVLSMLTDAGVRQSRMLFVSVIAAPTGIRRVRAAFPKLDMVVGVVDKGLNKQKFIIPGLGDFGDRYFGTVL